ncbi:MAG: hypothetical protein N3F09_02645 [Bacteroidia bacterium]|nr:hypothetical protein [Bacteroidia bacterium]
MKILIKEALIYSPTSPHHLHKKDILIRNGIIDDIGSIRATAEEVFEGEDILVTPQWADLMAFFCEPGEEHHETLKTGSDAACFSGFGHVAVHGYDRAPLHSQTSVNKVRRFEHAYVSLHPVGSLSEKYSGKNIPEIYDMMLHGSRWFSDGHSCISDEGTLVRIIQYANHIGAMPCFFPDTPSISHGGLMNESAESVKLGMRGIPPLAEEIFIEKLIRILEYTEGFAHVSAVSTAESVNIIRKAQKKNIRITCSVPLLNLIETDAALKEFDTNLKVLPPLRTKKDIQALIKGLVDGTILSVVSNHLPRDVEAKQREFDEAQEGHCTLPFFVPLFFQIMEKEFGLINKVISDPYRFLHLTPPVIEKGSDAKLSIFDMKKDFLLTKEKNPSLSSNSHLFGKKLTGKCLAVVNKQKVKIHD